MSTLANSRFVALAMACGIFAVANFVGAHEEDCPPAALTAAPVAELPSDIDFFAVSDLDQETSAGQLIGANPVAPSDYPASFYARHGSGACTGVMVSERVLLTAAHCVVGTFRARLKRNEQVYTGQCDAATGYVDGTDRSADYALCLLDRPMSGIKYERVSIDSRNLRRGMEVLLTGFGCIREDMTLGNDGVYRAGLSHIDKLPSGSSNSIVTKGDAALCPGDSGGPAFIRNSRGRFVISVNSAVRIMPGTRIVDDDHVSYLASLSTSAGKGFIEGWRTTNNVRICGVDAQATGCR